MTSQHRSARVRQLELKVKAYSGSHGVRTYPIPRVGCPSGAFWGGGGLRLRQPCNGALEEGFTVAGVRSRTQWAEKGLFGPGSNGERRKMALLKTEQFRSLPPFPQSRTRRRDTEVWRVVKQTHHFNYARGGRLREGSSRDWEQPKVPSLPRFTELAHFTAGTSEDVPCRSADGSTVKLSGAEWPQNAARAGDRPSDLPQPSKPSKPSKPCNPSYTCLTTVRELTVSPERIFIRSCSGSSWLTRHS